MSRSVCAAAVLFAMLAAPAAGSTPSPNLLANPGFEEPLRGHAWMPAAWETLEAGLPTVFFGRDTFLVHSGRYAVSVANASNLYPMWHNWSQTLIVGRELWGKDLVLTLWTRSIGLQGRGYVLLQAYRDTIEKMARQWKVERDTSAKRLGYGPLDDPHVVLGWQREYFSDPETDWVKRTVRIFVPPSSNIVIVRGGILGTGQVTFDDASLTAEPALPPPAVSPHTNMLADPGFEGDGNAWEYSMPPYFATMIEKDSTVVHGGKYSIHMRCGGRGGWVNTRMGVVQLIGNRGLGGKRLRLTGWVKTDSLYNPAYIKIYCSTLEGDVHNTPQQFNWITPWTKTDLEMDVPPGTYLIGAWFLFNAPAAGDVYFDDVSLEVIGPAVYVTTGTAPPRPAIPSQH
ncbi:MAG TPA: hypothetical protein VGK93_01670 [Candidatus Eisenbacteria bacterium]|jgi:hypothetical protein